MLHDQVTIARKTLEHIAEDPGGWYESRPLDDSGRNHFNPKSVVPSVERAIVALREAEAALGRVPQPDKIPDK